MEPKELCAKLKVFIEDEAKAVKEYNEMAEATKGAEEKPSELSEDFSKLSGDEDRHHRILTNWHELVCSNGTD